MSLITNHLTDYETLLRKIGHKKRVIPDETNVAKGNIPISFKELSEYAVLGLDHVANNNYQAFKFLRISKYTLYQYQTKSIKILHLPSKTSING